MHIKAIVRRSHPILSSQIAHAKAKADADDADAASAGHSPNDNYLRAAVGKKPRIHRSKREVVESSDYQEFASSVLIQHHSAYPHVLAFFFVIAHLVALSTIVFCYIQMSSKNQYVWYAKSIIPASVSYLIGNVVLVGGACFMIYLIKRKKGLVYCKQKLCWTFIILLLGAVLETVIAIPFAIQDSGSIHEFSKPSRCRIYVRHTFAERLYELEKRELTAKQEVEFCQVWKDKWWIIIKMVLAFIICGVILWMLVLAHFLSVALHYFDPNKALLNRYQEYSKKKRQKAKAKAAALALEAAMLSPPDLSQQQPKVSVLNELGRKPLFP